MKYLVITNCTSRKKNKPTVGLAKAVLIKNKDELESAANEWIKKVNAAKDCIPANILYQGRPIQDIKIAATLLQNTDIYFISAGLGLVEFNEKIPSYELSVTENTPFRKNLKEIGIPITSWWKSINFSRSGNKKTLSKLINTGNYDKIFIATSSSYLEFINDDLWGANPEELKKVLIFSSPYGQSKVPNAWKQQVIPYDERIEDKASGCAGTRVDFPQRTLRHFIEVLKLQNHSLEKSRSIVLKLIRTLNKPIYPTRKKVSDEEVTKLIKSSWSFYNGNSHKLLRHLRDIELISCEQSRFKKLWHETAQIKNGGQR